MINCYQNCVFCPNLSIVWIGPLTIGYVSSKRFWLFRSHVTGRAHQQSICRSPCISSQTLSQLPASGQWLSKFPKKQLSTNNHVPEEASKPIEYANNIQPFLEGVDESNIITQYYYSSWHSNSWVGFTKCTNGFKTGKYFRLTFDSCNFPLNPLPQSTTLQQTFEQLELITDSSLLHEGIMDSSYSSDFSWLLGFR